MATRILILFCIWVFGMSYSGTAQNPLAQSVNFVCSYCLPGDALVKLSSQTGINIVFADEIFQNCPPINIAAQQKSLALVLNDIAACASVSYQLQDGQIIFFRKIPRYTLSGYVQDQDTGERLIGASVKVTPGNNLGAITNEFGFFSLNLEAGAYKLLTTYIGYKPAAKTIDLNAHTVVIFKMPPNSALPEVVVRAYAGGDENVYAREKRQELSLSTLSDLPMPGGEADLLRMAALQTGVQTGVDGLGGLHVRGGNADQNLILMDDVPVYNPGHALGLFSVFNPATVNNARLWKGDFPARYGGRASSVLDVRTRDGNLREYHGELSAGLFAASATIEGPVVRDTSSFLISGRATYFGPWIDVFSKRENLLTFSGENVGYRFYDFNLKWNYIFSPRNRLYFSYYQGGDVFQNQFTQRFDDPEGLITDQYGLGSEWGNAIAALRWNHLLKPNLFTNTTLRFSRFFYQSQLTFLSNFLNASGREKLLANYGQFYQTLIQDWSVKTDFTFYPKDGLTLRWGLSYTFHTFQPGALSVNFLVPGQSPLTVDSLSKVLLNNERLGADEAEIYAGADWQVWKNWRLDAGLNFSAFQVRNTNIGALQPRLRLVRSGSGGWSQWAGYHRTAQYLHQIGTFNVSLPFELWVPSTPKVPSEIAWQTSAGFGWQRNGWRFSMEGYYKRLERLLTFISSNTALFAGGAEDASGWEDRIAVGSGKGYGVELVLEKTSRPLTATLYYSLSKADRLFPDLNSGRPFPFRFDRRHDLKLIVRQRLTRWLQANAVWAYATGNPITLAGVKFQHHTPNGEIERSVFVYTEVNGYRLPAYHRLDIALNANFVTGWTEHALQLGVYNAYNRANPFFLYIDSGSGANARAIQYTLLPLLPSFRYEVKF